MMPKPLRKDLTAERVRELLDYDPVTGALDWKDPTSTSPREGGKAGALGRAGSKRQFRRFIQIDYKRYPAHRVVWLHAHGELPDGYLLPQNNDYDDLRLENFRLVKPQELVSRTSGHNSANSSGVLGVSWDKKRERWQSYVTHNYKRIHLGYFLTIEEAAQARSAALERLDQLPRLSSDDLDRKKAAAIRDARLRVMWRKLQRQTGGITRWPSFEAFAADISVVPEAHGKNMFLKPVRPEETIGPGNFEWATHEAKWNYASPEGKRAYAQSHRDNNRSTYRDKELRKNFGISLVDYEQMRNAQGGVCAVCSKPERRTRWGKLTVLAVDHCHTTEAIRGLLCSSCNQAIGLLKDSPEVLRKAADYLERHAAKSNGAASPSTRVEER